MTKSTKWIAAIGILMLSILTTNAQVSTLGNTGGAADYVGWDINRNFPLTIAHWRTAGGGQPINFWTNNLQRATILANGNFGINTTSPIDRLHVAGLGFYDGIRLGNNFRLREYSANFGARTLEMYYDDATVAVNKLVLYGNTNAFSDNGQRNFLIDIIS